jgi:hypothetical protein
MARRPLPAVATVVSFIDRINRSDLDGLRELMHDNHTLVVLDESPLTGRQANVDAWSGYFSAFPDYVIYPRCIASKGSRVAVLGATTGSHLGLSDDEEAKLTVIWLASVADGLLLELRVAEDTPELRATFGIPASA